MLSGIKMRNNKSKVGIAVLAVFSLQLSNHILMAADGLPEGILLESGSAFLYGDHIEVGIAPNGAFGSRVPSPKGVRKDHILGYISDPSKRNFKNGYHGDFFTPEASEEGWAITLNDIAYNNNRNIQGSNTTSVKGYITNTYSNNFVATAVWSGEVNGLKVTQTFRIYKEGLAVIVDINLTNTTESIMNDVYYMRTVDPDNNADQNAWTTDSTYISKPLADPTHYITINTIIRQGSDNGGAAVMAKQSAISVPKNDSAEGSVMNTIDSVLGLCGHGANSRVAHGFAIDEHYPYYRYPNQVYNQSQEVGYEKTEDSPIAIAFKWDKIFPGQTVKFRAGYQLADIKPVSVDLDTTKSGNTFFQVYTLGQVATKITENNTSVSGLEAVDDLVGASIKITNAHEGDKLAIDNIPSGIRIDLDENKTDTEVHLTGSASKSVYIEALQQITFVNELTTSSTETRNISVMVLDTNYTPSTAAESIIDIVIPVTLHGDKITDDNIISASEADNIVLSGMAGPNLPINFVFTDENGETSSEIKPVMSDASGAWVLTNKSVDITALADGVLHLEITSTDGKGNVATYSIDAEKDTLILLEISSPQDGEIAASMNPLITGKADPDATIKITLNGTDYTTTADELGDWHYTLPEQTLGATVTLTITAEDLAQNTVSQEISIEIPSIPLEISDVDLSTTPTFSGTSTAGTKITVTVPTGNGHSESCTVITDADGKWSCQLPTLSSGGPYDAEVKADDNKGHTSTKIYEVTIPSLPLVIDSPADNSDLSDSSPTVSGTSNPGSTIIATVITPTGEEKCIATADESGKWSCELPVLPLASDLTISVVALDDVNNKTTKTITITTPTLPLKITGIDISTTPTFTGSSAPNANIIVTVPITNTHSEVCTTTTKADGSWSCTLPAIPSGGPYTATVSAEDENGNYATDTQVLSTPDLLLSVDSHADNAIISNATPIITGTGSIGTSITLSVDGKTLCSTETDAQGYWSCQLPSLPLSETTTLTITTKDDIGNSSTKIISLTTPALPLSITGVEASTTPILTGTSTPETLISVSLLIDDETTESCTATTDASGQWSCQLSAIPTGGPYTLTVEANDQEGNTSTINQEFTVPELPLIIDSPTNNAVILGTTPTISGTSLSGTIVTVTASSGESCTTVTDSNNHWHCELESLALDESVILTVTSEDSAGNKTTESIDIKTDKLPLDIISPENNSTAGDSTPNFIGTTMPGANVTVSTDTGEQCQAVADEKGHWACELSELSAGGPYTINIKSEDAKGNITEITESINIPKTPLIITSPTKNETLLGITTTVTGSSDPNSDITVLGADGGRCTTVTDPDGNWSCQLDNLQSGEGKYITVISGNQETGQKVSLVLVNIKNSAEKVTTIIKGGAGGLSLLMLFLLSLSVLLKRVTLIKSMFRLIIK